MNRKKKMTPADDVRETPPSLYQARSLLHGPFDLDACATHRNALAPRYYTENDGLCMRVGCHVDDGHRWAVVDDSINGLTGPWRGRVWCNPPFSELWAWIAKAWQECAAGNPDVIDLLSPGTRGEQKGWQKLVERFRDGKGVLVPGWRLDTEFVEGRQDFLELGQPIMRKNEDGSLWLNPKNGQPEQSSPKFGVVMLTWRKE